MIEIKIGVKHITIVGISRSIIYLLRFNSPLYVVYKSIRDGQNPIIVRDEKPIHWMNDSMKQFMNYEHSN